VKEVISENEGLHEREKAGLLKSVFDCVETGDEDDQELESEGKVGAGSSSLRTVVARTNTGKDEYAIANGKYLISLMFAHLLYF
jgi:hypothetical protein